MNTPVKVVQKDNVITILVPHGSSVVVKSVPSTEFGSIEGLVGVLNDNPMGIHPALRPNLDYFDKNSASYWSKKPEEVCSSHYAMGNHDWIRDDITGLEYCEICRIGRHCVTKRTPEPDKFAKPVFDYYDGEHFHGVRWMKREKELCDHVEATGLHAWTTKGDDTYCSFCKIRRY